MIEVETAISSQQFFGSQRARTRKYRKGNAMKFGLSRKLAVGIVGIGLFVLAIASSASVGAAAPVVFANGYAAPVVCGPYGSFPCDATYYPGVGYAYKDNRFCGDGNIIFTGAGYICADGRALYAANVPYVYSAYPVAVGAPVVAAPIASVVAGPVVGIPGYVAVNYAPAVVVPTAVRVN